MGGGTGFLVKVDHPYVGLSPRGRGNPASVHINLTVGRSIPAWAGEPVSISDRPASVRVYPRVGGGTASRIAPGVKYRGLSPRGRGNLCRCGCGEGPCGSIPAWAGEPMPMWVWRRAMWVYPRVGGGTGSGIFVGMLDAGLSPRGRGNHL